MVYEHPYCVNRFIGRNQGNGGIVGGQVTVDPVDEEYKKFCEIAIVETKVCKRCW